MRWDTSNQLTGSNHRMRGGWEVGEKEREAQKVGGRGIWLKEFRFRLRRRGFSFWDDGGGGRVARCFLCLSELAGFHPSIQLPSLYW